MKAVSSLTNVVVAYGEIDFYFLFFLSRSKDLKGTADVIKG